MRLLHIILPMLVVAIATHAADVQTGNLDVQGNITNAGTISATEYIGNGAKLTGVSAGTGSVVPYTGGTSNYNANAKDITNVVTISATEFIGDGSKLTGVTTGTGSLVPYTGAGSNLNLNAQDFTNAGTVSATEYLGDGSKLTGISITGNWWTNQPSTAQTWPTNTHPGNAERIIVSVDGTNAYWRTNVVDTTSTTPTGGLVPYTGGGSNYVTAGFDIVFNSSGGGVNFSNSATDWGLLVKQGSSLFYYAGTNGQIFTNELVNP